MLDSRQRPDIYYIIPDGYPSDEWHLTEMNLDNSEFTKALRERGFVIAPHAQSNYSATLNALAATLNMRYHESNLSGFADLDYLQSEIAVNEVARLLLERGYTFLQLMSGFLLPSPIADENLEFGVNGAINVLPAEGLLSPQRVRWGHENEPQVLDMLKIDENVQMPFAPLYFETTLLRIALPLLEDLRLASGNTPYGLYSPRRFLETLDELERIAQRPEATFTIAHLLKPHGPLSFDASGNTVERTWFPTAQAYEAELTFVNQMFLNTMDSILAASDGNALIIFQADHGTIHGRNSPQHNRMTQFDIYAAYYLPDGFIIEMPQPYTTINSFTLIMNEVFGAGLDLQEDRYFELPKGYDALFEQVEVTDEFLNRIARE
ncbi:MAG: sulfatase-like hydrolase/transferase [Chloroflexi bacterium]|nr:sulfatase-like hydrolase/transferase [Chloroflexota bacterium]